MEEKKAWSKVWHTFVGHGLSPLIWYAKHTTITRLQHLHLSSLHVSLPYTNSPTYTNLGGTEDETKEMRYQTRMELTRATFKKAAADLQREEEWIC